jgi:hypothetical protein
MSIKGQLHACSESLLTALKAAERTGDPDPNVMRILKACQDITERLEQSADDVTAAHLDMAASVLANGLVELGRQENPIGPVLGAVRKALDKLQRLRAEGDALS